jgi:tRNA modification GTPase
LPDRSTSTLFALASGAVPAAIAVVRISGDHALDALRALTSRALPSPRTAALRNLHHPVDGRLLDRALVLAMPGPGSPTGEDVVELHLHGGRAVVAAVLDALSGIQHLAAAGPGAFTRRAFDNGVMDLTQVEGLADLIDAETELQRVRALDQAGGRLLRLAEGWRNELLALSAEVESELDFSDEDDVGAVDRSRLAHAMAAVAGQMRELLHLPVAERLRDGIRVAFVGPPNSGKSSLVNAIAGRDVAIVTPIAGTTRDLIEVPLAIDGVPYVLIDTAGDRETLDPIEAQGVERARRAAAAADIVVDFSPAADRRAGAGHVIPVLSKCDVAPPSDRDVLRVSALTGEGLDMLLARISHAGALLARPTEAGGLANRRQYEAVEAAALALEAAVELQDMVLVAESLRAALAAIGRLTGRVGVEDMLDALFGRFCIGK